MRVAGRRHRGIRGHGEALAGGHGLPHDRRLGHGRDLRDWHQQPGDQQVFSGTIGLPLPSIEVAIKDVDGASLPLGEAGELCIRGPQVMTGYYRQPSETEKAFTIDGFMRIGDIGLMDERGYTRIIDRKKDMIIVSGFNLFPDEFENVISLCPGVVE